MGSENVIEIVELVATLVALFDGTEEISVGAVLSVVPEVWKVDSELSIRLPASSETPVNDTVYSRPGLSGLFGLTMKCTLSLLVIVTGTSLTPARSANELSKFPSDSGSEKVNDSESVVLTLLAFPAGD